MPPLWDLELNRDASEPLYRQIVREVEDRVERQELHVGVKLPSSRELAQHLRVHRTTVTAAYRELTERGVVEGRALGLRSWAAVTREAGMDSVGATMRALRRAVRMVVG